jgi:Tol biopolymer transport system component
MGDVYRARDTRLGRDVALKFLGDELRDDAEFQARFEREARAVAEVSHPNIAALFDIGRDGDVAFLVMELVEGETLATKLRKGPLPIESVCRLGAQIAGALAAAHARGIVHRDLKPANIIVTPAGAKLLDFGLARRFETGAADMATATESRELTAVGTVLGTVPYMAPEQVEGGRVDARTDVFALGSVLWEMATGRRAFDARTGPALIAAILALEPPPIPSLRPGAPPALDRLVRACLRKDPSQRWQSASDAAVVLDGIAGDTATGLGLAELKQGPTLRLVTLAAAAAAILLWGWQATTRADSASSAAGPVGFTLEPPEGGAFAYNVETNFLSFSPDGRQIAYTASDAGGPRLWIRELGSLSPRPLRGTEGAAGHSWSPDGRSIAFFSSGRLRRLDLPDGAPVTITDTGSTIGRYLSWGAGGSILFADVQGGAIYRVPADGGEPEIVVAADSTSGERRVQFPSWLPDGERFMYLSRGESDEGVLMLVSPSGATDTIMAAASWAHYSEPGVLAFIRDGSLLAQRFDVRSGRVSDTPYSVAEGVRYFLSTGAGAFATSAGATLAYQTGADLQHLVWFDRTGQRGDSVGPAANFFNFSISPDGTQLLFDRADPKIGTYDVGMLDLERGVASPITTSRATEVFATWVPGTDAVLYSISRGGPPSMVRRELGSGEETQLLPRGGFHQPTHVSPDGSTVLFNQRITGSTFDIWSLALDGEAVPSPLVQTSGEDLMGVFSPDGRWVAFLSNESGSAELYLTPFPGPGARQRVSPGGATVVRWSHASGELIWLTPGGRVMAARVQTDPLRLGAPTTLFTLPAEMTWTNFDVSPDGQRLLAAIPVAIANRQPVTVITNWTAHAGPGRRP